MIRAIKDFFEKLVEPETRTSGVGSEHALQVATAALLLEMMRMDGEVTPEERNAVTAALRTKFTLSDEEIETLIELADQEAREAPGFYQFTSLINKSFNGEQRAKVIEYLWQVAYADGRLDDHERHTMRKIANLLYVPHSEYIAAKLRARDAAGVPPEGS